MTSGNKITIAVLTYYCNRKTNNEIRQGKLYLAVVPEEMRKLFLAGPGEWEGNGVMLNLNLASGSTDLSRRLGLEYKTAKACHLDFWRWLMDSGPSKFTGYFGRADTLVVEADEAVGNNVALAEWARKIGKRLKISLDEKIVPVALCADFDVAHILN